MEPDGRGEGDAPPSTALDTSRATTVAPLAYGTGGATTAAAGAAETPDCPATPQCREGRF